MLFLAVAPLAGLADMELPSWVPFQGPASDTLPGLVTPGERITELRNLSETATAKSPEERLRISNQLAVSIQTEKDPLLRLEIVRTLCHYPGPPADAILSRAVNDDDVQVRVVACDGWGRRGGETAVKLLTELLRSDSASTCGWRRRRPWAKLRNAAAVAPLGEALADSNPAMQYQAVLALQEATGKDLGGDVGRWQRYVKTGGEPPAPSLADRIRQWF